MKRILFTVFLSVCFLCLPSASHAADSETDLLVQMLVENGTLTKDQAQKLAQKAKEKAEQKAKEEFAQQEREKTAKTTASAEQIHIAARETPAISTDQAKWEIEPKRIPMEASWKDGLSFNTADGNFEVELGGRVYADMLYTQAPSSLGDLIRPQGDFNRRDNEAFIRSARLSLEGTMFKNYFYSFEYEFDGLINNQTEVNGLRDVYLGMKDIPYIGRVTVGHMKEPFTLEEAGSHSNTTFLERSLGDVFFPGYSWGADIHNSWLNDRLTFSIGAFRNSSNSGDTVSGNEWNLTTRVTGLPWYAGEDKLLHLGMSYSLRYPESGGWNNTNNQIRFRERPELYERDYIVDTGNFAVNSENRLGLEGALVYGPFSAQGEVMQDWLENPYNRGYSKTGYLYGGYGYVSYILTGEHRIYDKNDGRFKGVVPDHIFSFADRTWGAWELAARCSYLCLDDKEVELSGGSAFDTTLGMNWYLNPNMRIMFDWVHSQRLCYGAIDGVQLRAQVDWGGTS